MPLRVSMTKIAHVWTFKETLSCENLSYSIWLSRNWSLQALLTRKALSVWNGYSYVFRVLAATLSSGVGALLACQIPSLIICKSAPSCVNMNDKIIGPSGYRSTWFSLVTTLPILWYGCSICCPTILTTTLISINGWSNLQKKLPLNLYINLLMKNLFQKIIKYLVSILHSGFQSVLIQKWTFPIDIIYWSEKIRKVVERWTPGNNNLCDGITS